MGRSRRSAVHKYHDRVAGRYDQTYDDAYWKWHDALTWDYLKPFLPENLSAEVVDLGCGTGKWATRIAQSGYRVTGVDISGKMIDQARRKAGQSASTARRLEFAQADLCDLSPLATGRFALAVALGEPIGCAASPAKAMKGIRRILGAGGVLVATFDNRLAAIDYYLSRGDRRALVRFLRNGETNWLTRDIEERFAIHTYGPGDVRRLVETAGFELLDMVGKTILPLRHYRSLLETGADRQGWAKVEKTLCRDPAAIGRAGHLQIACRLVR